MIESDRGQKDNQHNKGPANKLIHETGFEIKSNAHSRNVSNIEELIQEEMKLQEMKNSTRSAANIIDEDNYED